jgi:hypothetical protein
VALYEGEKNPLRLQLAKMLAYECSAQWWTKSVEAVFLMQIIV